MGSIWSRLRSLGVRDAVRRVRRGVPRPSVRGLVPRVVRRRYAWKFAAAMLVAMLVMGSVGAVSYARVTDSLDGQVEQQVTSTAELQADGMDEWLASKSAQTRSLSQAKAFQLGQERKIDLYLFDQADDLSADVVAIHYVRVASGDVVSSTAREMKGANAAEMGLPWGENRAAIDSATNDAGVVHVSQTPYRSPVADGQALAFVSAVPSNTEHAVVVTVNLTHRVDQFYQTMAGGETTVYTADGDPVVSTDSDAETAASNASAPVANLSAAAVGDAARFFRGDDAVAAYASLDGVNWVVGTRVPAESAYALRNGVGESLLWTVLAAVGALGVVAAALGRRTTRTLTHLTDRAETMADGDLSVPLESSREDEFGRLYDAFDEMRASLQSSLHEAEALNDHLESTAEEYRAVMERSADGDLACRMDPDDENEAMADVARAYNRTMDELAAVVADAQAFSEDVAEAGAETSASVAEVREASESVSASMTDILDDAVRQDDHLTDAADRMTEFSATIQQMTASAADVADRADAARERGERGRAAAEDAVTELRAIDEATATTVETVAELEAVIEEIESVVSFIDDIADQTNVLALNASIEAARAGEAGEGFAVVADEVKQLAEETQAATGDIESSIDRVRDQTETTAADIRRTRERVVDGSETVEEAMEAIETIVDDVERTTEDVREIRAATERQAATAAEVEDVVADVSDISDRTSSAAEDAAAATQQQTASLASVSDGVDSLADRADDLRGTLDRFDVTGETAVADESSPADADTSPSVDDALDADTSPATDDALDADTSPPTDTESSSRPPDAVSVETDGGDVRD
ncbi:methyl-accepting chemotaxis protein [Halogeometricum rufum]|uniref:Methyl-accepting chemotaxis protein n=1 Tax=Halogeometricum rufum TaxID=553469 RepID=A0A1I6I3J4_9EURY|nr:methyl-accepting chemotaxis protein [Halogeometricum rufum]SFR61297.1 methyl-accepting chemotaxis protein [Halogeometricum rufum]